jgi:hypothetical protein
MMFCSDPTMKPRKPMEPDHPTVSNVTSFKEKFETFCSFLFLGVIIVGVYTYWPWDSTRDQHYHRCMAQPGTRMEHLDHCMAAAGYTFKRDCRAPFGADAMIECFYVKHWWSGLSEKKTVSSEEGWGTPTVVKPTPIPPGVTITRVR